MRKSIALLSALGLLAASCGTKDVQENQEVLRLEVTSPVQVDSTIEKEYVADIHAVQNVEIRARIKGYLDKIWVDEGKFVRKGQALFSINSQEYRTELLRNKALLEQVKAELEAQDIELKNTQLLVDKKVISPNQLAIARAKIAGLKAKRQEAESSVAAAQLRLDLSLIKAPFDGYVDRLPLKVGSLVDEGALLTTLSDTRELLVYFNVSESEYLDFAQGKEKPAGNQSVRLKLANGDIFERSGKIETIEGEFDKATGNIAFRARFENLNHLLRHGSSGKVLMPKTLKKQWLIPQKAVFEIQDKSYVFTVNAQGQLKIKSLKPDVRIEHFYLVKSGFDAQEKILLEGIQLVKQGQKIQPEFISLKQFASTLK